MTALDRVRPDPGTARDWLREELRNPAYHRSLLERVTTWIHERIDDALNTAGQATTFSTLATLVLLAIVVVVAVLALRRLRYEKTVGSTEAAGRVGAVVSAEEHRGRARTALVEGRHEDAVIDAVRAIARDLVDRTVLPDDPGTTAHELALAAGTAFPDQAARLVGAANLFDAVQYGGRPATAEDARGVLELDRVLQASRPVRSAADALR